MSSPRPITDTGAGAGAGAGEVADSPRFLDEENNPSPAFSRSPAFFSVSDAESPAYFSARERGSPVFFGERFAANASPKGSPSAADSVRSPSNRPRFELDADDVFSADSEADGVASGAEAGRVHGEESVRALSDADAEDKLLNNFRRREDAASRRRSFVRSDANSSDGEDPEINDNGADAGDDPVAIPENGGPFEERPVSTDVHLRRNRLKSISLDSDNAKFIERNLSVPVVKRLRCENPSDRSADASDSFRDDSHDKFRRNSHLRRDEFDDRDRGGGAAAASRSNGNDDVPSTFAEPRLGSPEGVNSEREASPKIRNFRNLTIDPNEIVGCDSSRSPDEKRMTPKTPTLKVKATSLDSSETLNLSLPRNDTLRVPRNSVSVPNTPKRQSKRALSHKSGKLIKGRYAGNLNEISLRTPEAYSQRKSFAGPKCANSYMDSGIFLKENHAPLMPFQGSKYQMHRTGGSCNFSIKMGSFDENTAEASESVRSNVTDNLENRFTMFQQKSGDGNLLGSNLSNFKQNLSMSSTNLKTLPEGVPSYDFDVRPEEKSSKKTLLQRRGSNQSLTINLDGAGNNLKFSTLSLQSSNLSLASFGASNHNLANIKNSASNFSLNTDNRQKKNLLERRNSNTSLTLNLDCNPHRSAYSASNSNLQVVSQETQQGKKCLLQRRGSNTSLTLNLQGISNSNLNRCTSNSSLNVHNDNKIGQKKGLLERRSSNTSLTLNVNAATGGLQLDNDRVFSVSNYNLATLSRHNSNQSISNDMKKNLVPREIDIDNIAIESFNSECSKGEKHRKSLSTENLFPKSYKCQMLQGKKDCENVVSFGSHDNLWSRAYTADSFENVNSGEQNLTYVCGDQENEMIYAFADRQHIESVGPIRNITTKPLSPHSTSADFKTYLANIQHLQNATNSLSRQQLKDLHSLFKGGYAKADQKNASSAKASPLDSIASAFSRIDFRDENLREYANDNDFKSVYPNTTLECQKALLRTLHQEFWDLPTNFQEKPMVFGSHQKNRYRSILPNEHSRVILRAESGNADEGYINANYIKGHEYTKNSYIATQGPLQNTLYDFWLMVYQNASKFHQENCARTNEDRHFGSPLSRTIQSSESQPKSFTQDEYGVQKIVMLTNFVENGRSKCERYFPVEVNQEMVFKQNKYYNDSGSFGDGSYSPESRMHHVSETETDVNYFKVQTVAVVSRNGYSIRKLVIKYTSVIRRRDEAAGSGSLQIVADSTSTDTITVYHYWFDNWADHKCPGDVKILLDFCLDILKDTEPDFQLPDPTIVSKVLLKTRNFEKLEIARAVFDKSTTVCDFSSINKVQEIERRPGNLDLDLTGISKERRLSAFQLAKAFFDEVSKANSSSEDFSRVGTRKNSLASRLDVPKPVELTTRRESTGKIDCKNRERINIAPQLVKHSEKSNWKHPTPIIVHCSAGIGRTGCLIGTLNGLKQLKADQKVDVLGIVCNMRLNRGGMVQNSEQYELIHKVLCLYEELGLSDMD